MKGGLFGRTPDDLSISSKREVQPATSPAAGTHHAYRVKILLESGKYKMKKFSTPFVNFVMPNCDQLGSLARPCF
jgi:hypothetical protein